ncbi:translational machinery component, partial [Calocera cornea HHB12733]
SGGTVGFKGHNRNSFEAAHQACLAVFATVERIMSRTDVRLELRLNGYGNGREAAIRALMGVEGERVRESVVRVTDTTPIKIGGVRAKKLRRL